MVSTIAADVNYLIRNAQQIKELNVSTAESAKKYLSNNRGSVNINEPIAFKSPPGRINHTSGGCRRVQQRRKSDGMALSN